MQDVDHPLIHRAAPSMAYQAGPFFLGFALECFGMGIVLILSINYYLTLASQPKSSHESSRRLGVCLVGVSLVLNLTQTIVDLFRGWDMFATNFTNIAGFLTSSSLFFISPFLGLIQSTITQLFLLRRITLFISSLDLLWPKLAHPIVKYTFSTAIGIAVLSSFMSGTISSVLVWKSGSLITLGIQGDYDFARAERTWLSTSTVVDTLLSLVLSIELWWARQKLGMQGGVMREIVTRLILVTCHGGLAVSGLQLSSLLLYNYWRFNAFCYLPIIFLPKVYNITLILSLSVPHSIEIAPNPSHMFSLPTILDTQIQPNSSNEPNRRISSSAPNLNSDAHEKQRIWDEKHCKHHSKSVDDIEEQGNRRKWLSWSVGAVPTTSYMRQRQSTSKNQNYKRHSYNDSIQERRPSDPNSICPLLTPKLENRTPHQNRKFPMEDITLPSPPPTSMTIQRSHPLSPPIVPGQTFDFGNTNQDPENVTIQQPALFSSDPFSSLRSPMDYDPISSRLDDAHSNGTG